MVQMKKKIRTIISKQEEDMACELKKKKKPIQIMFYLWLVTIVNLF